MKISQSLKQIGWKVLIQKQTDVSFRSDIVNSSKLLTNIPQFLKTLSEDECFSLIGWNKMKSITERLKLQPTASLLPVHDKTFHFVD